MAGGSRVDTSGSCARQRCKYNYYNSTTKNIISIVLNGGYAPVAPHLVYFMHYINIIYIQKIYTRCGAWSRATRRDAAWRARAGSRPVIIINIINILIILILLKYALLSSSSFILDAASQARAGFHPDIAIIIIILSLLSLLLTGRNYYYWR